MTRMGRPRLKAGEKRGITLRFMVRPDERELFESVAELEGLSVSEWMRGVLTRTAERRLKRKKGRPAR